MLFIHFQILLQTQYYFTAEYKGHGRLLKQYLKPLDIFSVLWILGPSLVTTTPLGCVKYYSHHQDERFQASLHVKWRFREIKNKIIFHICYYTRDTWW